MRNKNNTLSPRKLLIMGIFIAVGIVFILKLFSLQVVDKSYVALADNNALRYVTQYPARGKVFDRNDNWKNRGYGTAVIVAPIELGGADCICEVIVK